MMNKNIVRWILLLVLGGWVHDVQAQETPAAQIANPFEGASKENPFVNTLGMKFVPVPETEVLFSNWETRIKDYRGYAIFSVDGSWKECRWAKQGDNDPVASVSWDDAKAFCLWLTKKERKEGRIRGDQEYRLPTDKEWSAAVGVTEYPWGNDWPPQKGVGNYNPKFNVDDYQFTSPVGSFKANDYGLYDMGGNVSQWCEDPYRMSMNEELFRKYPALKESRVSHSERVIRNAADYSTVLQAYFLSSARTHFPPSVRVPYVGFRCVLAPAVKPAPSPF